jgi:hypothetical protein
MRGWGCTCSGRLAGRARRREPRSCSRRHRMGRAWQPCWRGSLVRKAGESAPGRT